MPCNGSVRSANAEEKKKKKKGCPAYDYSQRSRRRNSLSLQTVLMLAPLEAKETNPSRLLSCEISIWDTSHPKSMALDLSCNPQPHFICIIYLSEYAKLYVATVDKRSWQSHSRALYTICFLRTVLTSLKKYLDFQIWILGVYRFINLYFHKYKYLYLCQFKTPFPKNFNTA